MKKISVFLIIFSVAAAFFILQGCRPSSHSRVKWAGDANVTISKHSRRPVARPTHKAVRSRKFNRAPRRPGKTSLFGW